MVLGAVANRLQRDVAVQIAVESQAHLGPQHDDILASQRGYGDPYEHNDSAATATDLGAFADGDPLVATPSSIDDNSDTDWTA